MRSAAPSSWSTDRGVMLTPICSRSCARRASAAFLDRSLENTVIIAPRFASNHGGNCHDSLSANELNWNCDQSPQGWRVGGHAVDNERISSFDIVDEILRKLARKEVFPSLKAIVVAGHSGGGQFVQRYEMTNQVHDRLSGYVCRIEPIQLCLPGQPAANTQCCLSRLCRSIAWLCTACSGKTS